MYQYDFLLFRRCDPWLARIRHIIAQRREKTYLEEGDMRQQHRSKIKQHEYTYNQKVQQEVGQPIEVPIFDLQIKNGESSLQEKPMLYFPWKQAEYFSSDDRDHVPPCGFWNSNISILPIVLKRVEKVWPPDVVGLQLQPMVAKNEDRRVPSFPEELTLPTIDLT